MEMQLCCGEGRSPCRLRCTKEALLLPTCVKNRTVLVAVSMVMGTLAMAIAGSVYVFNTYANAAKATFNLTQPQVELLGALTNLGVCTAFPAGILQEKLGPASTFVAGALLTCTVFMLLWKSVVHAAFYHNNFFLLAIYFFMTGFGSNFPYIAALDSNMRNFPGRHRGKVVAVLDSAFSTGPLIIAAVYAAFYIRGHVTDEQNQDLGGFFILLALLFAGICIAGAYTIGIYPAAAASPAAAAESAGETRSGLTTQAADFSSLEGEPSTNSAPQQDEEENKPLLGGADVKITGEREYNVTGWAMVKDPTFHLVTWPLILSAAIQLMFFNNIGIYLKSFGHEAHTTSMAMTNFASCTVAKLAVGTLSDYALPVFPRVTFILAANLLQAACMFLAIFWADSLAFLYLTTVATSVSNGSFWCLMPTIASEYFGTEHIGRNWGLMLFCTGPVGWLAQVAYGEMYAAAIHAPGETYCYGLHCFTWSFVMGFGFTIVSVLLTTILLYEVRRGTLPRRAGPE